MAVNTIGATTSLPAGTVARIGGGYTRSGYGFLQGNFPAGNYLIQSSAPCSVSMGSAFDVRDFESFVATPGSTVISTTSNTNVFEYQSSRLNLAPKFATNASGAGALAINNAGAAMITSAGNSFQVGRLLTPVAAATNFYINIKGAWVWYSGGGGVTASIYYSTNNFTTFTYPGDAGTIMQTTGGVFDNTRWAYNGSVAVFANQNTTSGLVYSTNVLAPSTYAAATAPNNSMIRVMYGKGQFIAYTNSGTSWNRSTDGINWVSATGPGSGITNIVYQNGVFVALYPGSRTASFYSNDGITWTSLSLPFSDQTNPGDYGFASIAAGNGVFVATGYTSLNYNPNTMTTWWSVDGVNWTKSLAALPYGTVATSSGTQITFNGSHFFATTNDGGNGALASLDGQTWYNYNALNSQFSVQNMRNSRGQMAYPLNTVVTGLIGFADLKQPNSYFDVYLLDSNTKVFN